ncbi:hypothetical protein, partial [Kitasatospora sp. NPDC057223]|uniref:hypothetical protein n=1 Tax=Kitasatospora sp. NPDC057223 TaxID=3346055 RepID=UPI003642B4F6
MTDTGHPLGAPEHGPLLPPPAPAPPAVGRSTPATALYVLACVITVFGLINVAHSLPDVKDADPAYRLGFVMGPLVFSAPLALIGLVVQLATKRRRVRAAEEGAKALHALWERRHRVWLAAWLCRRCGVAFFPKGSVTPDYPASPPLAVEQLPVWVTTTAERAFGVPEPARSALN